MAALIEGGTCACVIYALIVSLIIYALGERTHTKVGGQEHIFLLYAILHLHHMCEIHLMIHCIMQTM